MKYVYPFDEARYQRDAEQGDESEVFEIVPIYLPNDDQLKGLLERDFSSCIEVRDISVPLTSKHNLELLIQPLPGSEPNDRRLRKFGNGFLPVQKTLDRALLSRVIVRVFQFFYLSPSISQTFTVVRSTLRTSLPKLRSHLSS